MKNTSVRRASKSKLCDSKNEQEDSQKESSLLVQGKAQNKGQESADQEANKITRGYEPCLDISISSVGLGDSASQPNNLGEYKQLSLWNLTPTLNSSLNITSQEFQFTQTLETISQSQENSTLLPAVFPVQVQVTQELELDSSIQSQHFGERDLDVLWSLNPSSVLSNNLKELSNEDFELFLVDSTWQDTVLKLKQSRRRSLEQDTRDSDCLSFPTLTSGQTSSKMRPAGQNGRLAHPNSIRVSRPPKCEKWFKDKGLIPNGYQLGTKAIASLMNFPMDWFSPLSPTKPQAELEPDILQDEQLPQHKQRSPSVESSISIPCVVKQPKHPEVKGVIKQDLGDCEASRRHRFLVDVSDKTISVSKLFVYPDFSETVPQGYNIGQLGKISPTKKVAPPSKIPPTKSRRKKGDGTGYIYRRTITRRGKEYQESYFRYRDESGKLRSKYIPQRLLDKVQEAESRKKPIADILVLLGGDEISRGEQFSTLDNEKVRREASPLGQNSDENNQSISLSRGEQLTPPSTKRKQGDGTGYIECKPIKRSGKEYKQYWYHYEEWREGDRVTKKSRYIPKRLLARVEKLEAEKVAVREILVVLGMKG